MTWLPHGFGYFLASRDVARDPDDTARLLFEGGASWCLGWVEAPDGRRADVGRLVALAAEVRARGIAWGLWTMPRPGDVTGAVRRLDAACAATDPVHVSLNVERPTPKARASGEREWSMASAGALYDGALDAIREPASLSLSSMALRSRWARWIPWDALPCSVGMPELYAQADDPSICAQADREWGAACADGVVPIIDTFVGDADRLRGVLTRMGERPLAIWDLATTSADERRVILKQARAYGWRR